MCSSIHCILCRKTASATTKNRVLDFPAFRIPVVLVILYGIIPTISADYNDFSRNRPVSRMSRNVEMVVPPPQPWAIYIPDQCISFLESINQAKGEEGWCPGITDEVLCWPAAPPGETITQLCPRMQGVDPTKYAKKICGSDGKWTGLPGGDHGEAGYTHYDDCFTDDTKALFEVFLGDSNNTNERFEVLHKARAIEMSGFPLSFICVLVSLFIFRYFRSLRCARTTIHVHLFIAIAIMTLSKTTEIADQIISGYGKTSHSSGTISSLRSMRPLCEILVIVIEFGRTAMFMWMFLEGLYMHNAVAWKVFEASKPNYWLYCAVGWGFPALLVSAWAPIVEFVWLHERFLSRNKTNEDMCWYQHAGSLFYYILEVPRHFFIAINLIFLINIIRVLLTKLRDSHQSDTVQIRKAVKATIVLAPLLGVTNLIWAVPPPINSEIPYAAYAGFMYVSHFLRSFEGFFVCLVYCFLNGEVQSAIRSACQRRAIQRETNRNAARRVSSLSSSHLTRYMQVNRESVQSEPNRREPSNRFLKLFPCWANTRTLGGSARNSRKPSQIPNDTTTTSMHFPFNGTIKEEREENIEM
ncbi:PDF receptor-like [Paramacrobiotus metropolitanus]|uniref:PDF receptor-like n=1 Tax=Paramacrobiotus metropolitanus TaxID=2943436 RepID=UPI002446196E|nr:PDF receptor-like [Paramacrobiotus metropolitanus]